MKYAVGPRREMGVRTVFNMLGPLTNPAGAEMQLLGVYDGEMVTPLAEVLAGLGSQSAAVVHGADGLDELATSGPSQVALLRDGVVRTTTLNPQALGLASATLHDIRGGDPNENAAITRAVLAGRPGPHRDITLLNAGLALVVANLADDLPGGISLAGETVDSGRAAAVLENLVTFTGELA